MMFIYILICIIMAAVIVRFPQREPLVFKGLKFAGIGLFVWMAITAVLLLFSPMLMHQSDLNIVSVGTAWLHGHPIYTALDDPRRYSMFYGPFTYLMAAFMTWTFDNPQFLTKLPGIVCFWTALMIWYRLLSKKLQSQQFILFAMLTMLAFLGRYFQLTYSPRLAYTLLFSTVAFYIVQEKPFSLLQRYLLVGLLMGLASVCNIYGFIYIAPMAAVLLINEYNKRNAIVALGVALFSALIFFALPGVSLPNYLNWLFATTQNGFDWDTLVKTCWYLLGFLFPAFLFRKKLLQEPIVLPLIGGTLGILIFASRMAGGPNNYMPFIPIYVYLMFHQFELAKMQEQITFRNSKQILLASYIALALVQGIGYQKEIARITFSVAQDWHDYSALKSLVDKSEGGTMLGFNSGDRQRFKSFFNPYVIHRSGEIYLETSAMMDMNLSGLDYPQATWDFFKSCSTKYIILPADGKWLGYGSDYSDSNVYPDPFLKIFRKQYKKVAGGEEYNLFKCGIVKDRKKSARRKPAVDAKRRRTG